MPKTQMWQEVYAKVKQTQKRHLKFVEGYTGRGYETRYANLPVYTKALEKKLKKDGHIQLAWMLDKEKRFTSSGGARVTSSTAFLNIIYDYPITPKYIKKAILEGKQKYRYNLYRKPLDWRRF